MIYEKLANRYRPKNLHDLFGQDQIKHNLLGMFKNGRIDRTFLIAGPFGSGKTTTARLIARYLNCLSPVDHEPCGTCVSCVRMDQGSHPDVVEINAADSRGIETIRSLIGSAGLSPQTNYRVFILDECHQLTPQAFQALLKTTEEPPPKSVWILCTTEPQRIPNTIVSRCTKLIIQRVGTEETAKLLEKVVKAEGFNQFTSDVLLTIAQAVHGHPRDALSVLEAIINIILAKQDNNVNIAELIPTVVSEIVESNPNELVRKFLISVYQGKYTPALMVVQTVQNHTQFVESLLSHHQHTIYASVSNKLRAMNSMTHQDWYDILDQKSLIPPKQTLNPVVLSDLNQLFMTVLSQIKSYAVDPFYALFNLATASVSVVKSAPTLFLPPTSTKD